MNNIIKLEYIEKVNCYLAYIEQLPGLCETGITPEEAIEELMISLKVKLEYDLKIWKEKQNLKSLNLQLFSLQTLKDKKEKFAINCKTKEELEEISKIMPSTIMNIIKKSWNNHKELFCVNISGKAYGSIEDYSNMGYTIISATDFIKDNK